MVHDYSDKTNTAVRIKKNDEPRQATINFVKQFARTYVALQGCTLGAMVLN